MRRNLCILAVGAAGLVLAGCGEASREPAPVISTLVFGEVGRSPGQFSYPRAMDGWTDADGDWLVVIDKTARVQRFDARTGAFVGGFRMPRLDRGKPTGVTAGAMPGQAGEAGRRVLWVADTHEHRVLGFEVPEPGSDPGEIGEPLFEFGGYGEGGGQFIYPTDVEVLTDADGRATRVYVSEYGGNDRVSCFEPVVGGDGQIEFEYLFAFGEQGGVGDVELDEEEGPFRHAGRESFPGGTGGGVEVGAAALSVRFNRPQEIFIDRVMDELIICDAINHRIGRFTLDGGLIGWVGSPGRALGRFDHPYALAMLDDGTSLVCEFGAGRVQHVDVRTGASLGQIGRPGRGDGLLGNPWEVIVLGDDAFVLDSGNNRVMRFDVPKGRRAAQARAGGGEYLSLRATSQGDGG